LFFSFPFHFSTMDAQEKPPAAAAGAAAAVPGTLPSTREEKPLRPARTNGSVRAPKDTRMNGGIPKTNGTAGAQGHEDIELHNKDDRNGRDGRDDQDGRDGRDGREPQQREWRSPL